MTAAAVLIAALFLADPTARAYTANKVWFEFHPNGIYRVVFHYTIPEFKEAREAYAEFRKRRDAEAFYWDLLKGADVFTPDPKMRRFVKPVSQPEPW